MRVLCKTAAACSVGAFLMSSFAASRCHVVLVSGSSHADRVNEGHFLRQPERLRGAYDAVTANDFSASTLTQPGTSSSDTQNILPYY